MRILLDTNILGRLSQPDSPLHECARRSVERLKHENHELRIVPQVLYEYWAIATRPVVDRGLGFTTDEARERMIEFKLLFPPFRDERGILERWDVLVSSYSVQGKTTHDARLVAAMQRHGVSHLLTFNIADFRRYTGVELLNPEELGAA